MGDENWTEAEGSPDTEGIGPDTGLDAERKASRRFPVGLVALIVLGLGSGILMALLTVFNPFGGSGAAGSGAASSGAVSGLTSVPAAVQQGDAAPDFTAQTLRGETVTLSDFSGRPVLINFWATWCGPCRVEMPALQSASERYGDDLTILAVNAMESPDAVGEYMDELGLTFPAVLDPDGEVIDQYQVRVFPTTVVVGADGNVLAEHYGALTDELIDEYVQLALDS